MKSILRVLTAATVLASSLSATVIGGKITDLTGQIQTSNRTVKFVLQNCGNNLPRVVGASVVVPSTLTLTPNAAVTEHRKRYANKTMPNPTNVPIVHPELPLHTILRRRREELSLCQWQIAEVLHVSPECITLWEAGRRRMELAKIPRLAAVLQLDPRLLCAKALAEFHPAFYAALFGAHQQLQHSA